MKKPGKLVCNKRYVDDLQNGKSYHIDWGDGKDCYKVGRSLGAGASAVVVPDTEFSCLSDNGDHALVGKEVKSGDTFTYYFASCWNKGDIKSRNQWLGLISESVFE